MMEGRNGGLQWKIFDYYYVISHGKSRETRSQTVFLIEKPGINLPHFSLMPENFLTKMANMFMMKDIDFDNHPVFSKKYLLTGSVEDSIRQFFDERKIRYFENTDLSIKNIPGQKSRRPTKFTIEGFGKHVAFISGNKRVNVETINYLMTKFRELTIFLTKDLPSQFMENKEH